MKKVAVYGVGNLGMEILKGLSKRGVKLNKFSYNKPGAKEKKLNLNGQDVRIVNSYYLKEQAHKEDIKKHVSYIVVTVTGKVLEKDIDLLLSLKTPLIILSTQYDVEMIRNKAINAGISVVMSENMAFGIVDFWNKLDKIPKVPDNFRVILQVIESNPYYKEDISGSAIIGANKFKLKGVEVNFSEEQRKRYKPDIDGDYGCIRSERDEITQEMSGVPVEYIDSHAYHSFFLNILEDESDVKTYLKKLYFLLKPLEVHTIPGILEFEVNLFENSLDITHNINGRDIYTEGVLKSIDFLESQEDVGVFTGLDVIGVK